MCNGGLITRENFMPFLLAVFNKSSDDLLITKHIYKWISISRTTTASFEEVCESSWYIFKQFTGAPGIFAHSI